MQNSQTLYYPAVATFKRRLTLIIILMLLGMLFILSTAAKASAMSAGAIISITNQKRAENGLAPLNTNWALMSSSAAKANDMFANNYWSHVSPSGLDPWYFIGASGYNYVTAGENLAKDYQSEYAVVDGWMNSPTHRQNMLNSSFRDIGVTAQAGQLLGAPTVVVVAHYGATAYAPAPTPAPAPAPAPTPTTTAPVVTEPAAEPVTDPAPTPTEPETKSSSNKPAKKQHGKKLGLSRISNDSSKKLLSSEPSFIPVLIGLFKTSAAGEAYSGLAYLGARNV